MVSPENNLLLREIVSKAVGCSTQHLDPVRNSVLRSEQLYRFTTLRNHLERHGAIDFPVMQQADSIVSVSRADIDKYTVPVRSTNQIREHLLFVQAKHHHALLGPPPPWIVQPAQPGKRAIPNDAAQLCKNRPRQTAAIESNNTSESELFLQRSYKS